MSNPSVSLAARIEFDQTLEEAFPDVDPQFEPLGAKVLIQMCVAKTMSKGGIALPSDTRETIQWNTQVGKVRAVGPTAFKNQQDMTPWPEGDWCKVGDFVRVPKFGADKFEVALPDKKGVVLFVVFDHLALIGKVKDPTKVVAFV